MSLALTCLHYWRLLLSTLLENSILYIYIYIYIYILYIYRTVQGRSQFEGVEQNSGLLCTSPQAVGMQKIPMSAASRSPSCEPEHLGFGGLGG